MNRWLIAVSLGGLFLLQAPSASACTCIIPEVKDALNRADVVFEGKVKEIVEPKKSQTTSSPESKFYIIKFEVEKTWKGAILTEFSVLSAQGNGCFAYRAVKKGERYLVFADPLDQGARENKWSIITKCNRTELSAKSEQDIRALNSLTSPIQLTPAKRPTKPPPAM
jgi:hypothetical protein